MISLALIGSSWGRVGLRMAQGMKRGKTHARSVGGTGLQNVKDNYLLGADRYSALR